MHSSSRVRQTNHYTYAVRRSVTDICLENRVLEGLLSRGDARVRAGPWQGKNQAKFEGRDTEWEARAWSKAGGHTVPPCTGGNEKRREEVIDAQGA